MSIKGLFIIFLFSHILGDFYMQNNGLAQRKDQEFRKLLLHAGLYAVPVFAAAAVFFSVPVLILAAVLMLVHFMIDGIKMVVLKTNADNKSGDDTNGEAVKQGVVYVADQMLHLLVIYIACAVFIKLGWTYELHSWSVWIVSLLGVDMIPAAKWIFTLLLLLKPVNITFAKVFSAYKPIEDEIERFKGAGAWIGNLERLLIVLLLSLGQYAAIGLAITAKSIVRYPQIKGSKAKKKKKGVESKDTVGSEFGEYYLIGTLFSFISAIVIYNFIW